MEIERARAAIVGAVKDVPGVRDVEAVVVLAGPGANAMNAGLLLAGTDLATAFGCPAYVGALTETGEHADGSEGSASDTRRARSAATVRAPSGAASAGASGGGADLGRAPGRRSLRLRRARAPEVMWARRSRPLATSGPGHQ